MPPFELHHQVKRGNLQRVREILLDRPDLNTYDNHGYTPLMYAVESPNAGVDMVRLLLDHGASIHQECSRWATPCSVLALCIAGGNPRKVVLLLEAGGDVHYETTYGFDAVLDAVYSPDVPSDQNLIELLKLLLSYGVGLDGISTYGETALRTLSNKARFDAVQLLLDAGADEGQLEWTPLIRAVALGSLADVASVVRSGADLEGRDRWLRTAYLVAIQTGDIAKASFLLECGADREARGRCGKPPLFYAIESYHHPAMLEWLLESGIDIEQTDESGWTSLIQAVECATARTVDRLLRAGADVNADRGSRTALSFATTREVAAILLDAGADPANLPFEARRSLLGLDPEPDESLLDVSPPEFHKGWSRRLGISNPEKISEPFWIGMIRAGVSAFQAAQRYGRQFGEAPIWCAWRFGPSITWLPDGRIIQIAGEHEDSYDEDFCIYNDVFVHQPDGTIHIFGYPESVFPPTDFHTATLIGEYIYIIGSLGYLGARRYGTTPIYRLHTTTLQIEPLQAQGEAPGWIYKHRALQVGADEIHISGGKIASEIEVHTPNEKPFILDVKRLTWRPAT
ncbi:MAG TPA: ankyrin repeat domain-containing protein [Bryobacteraceae bacterium]|jgi:ankyrin repeat protein